MELMHFKIHVIKAVYTYLIRGQFINWYQQIVEAQGHLLRPINPKNVHEAFESLIRREIWCNFDEKKCLQPPWR